MVFALVTWNTTCCALGYECSTNTPQDVVGFSEPPTFLGNHEDMSLSVFHKSEQPRILVGTKTEITSVVSSSCL